MKKIVLLISIMVLAVSLVGCGGDTKKQKSLPQKRSRLAQRQDRTRRSLRQWPKRGKAGPEYQGH